MNAEKDNVIEVVNEAIRKMPLSTPGAEQLLLSMMSNGIREAEVERMARQYGIESTDLQCNLVNAGILITRSLLHLAVEKGVLPVHALATLRCNSEVYESLIMKRDDSAVLTLFEKIVDIAA